MKRMELITKILGFLRPKYYNGLTKIIVFAGLALLSKPLWIDLLYLFLGASNPTLQAVNPLWGIVLVVIALSYNTLLRYFDWKFPIEDEPAFKNTIVKQYTCIEELSQEIYPLLRDNEYVFNTTGPNSNADSNGPVRFDLTLWESLKKEIILPNNLKMKELIDLNKHLIPTKEFEIFSKMNQHLIAFEKHLSDPTIDYSNSQFPSEFPNVIMKHCFDGAIENKHVQKQIRWLSRKLKRLRILNAYLFGSLLFSPTKANDTDILLLHQYYETSDVLKISKKIKILKEDFKIKFKKNLHFSIFNKSELSDYEIFKEKNPYILDLIYG